MEKKQSPRKWSRQVTRESHALALDNGVFTWKDPAKIAGSLKRSAETSKDRKAEPYQSAMSMLNFYINRGGKNLPAYQKKILNDSKAELKKQFNRA